MTYDDPTPRTSGAGSSWPDLDTLADFHAGALDADTAAWVAQHVAANPSAQRIMAALDATVTDLRSLPPVEVPEFVARRIDNALAAEAGRTSTVRDLTGQAQPSGPRPLRPSAPRFAAPPPQPAAPVIDLDQARLRRSRQTRLLSVIAAGVIVVGGGAYAAAQIGSGGPASDIAGGGASTSQGAAAPSDAVAAPPGQYDATTIGTAAPDVLSIGKITDGKADSTAAGKMAEVFERNKCLLLLRGTLTTQPEGNPLAVQQITYEKQPAYAFVFPTSKAGIVRIVVVAADKCSELYKDVEVPAAG